MRTLETADGRVFTSTGTRPHVRKDGKPSALEDWRCRCRHQGCENFFTITTPQGADAETSKAFGRVHCDDHKLTRAECLALAAAGRKARKDATPPNSQ